VKSGERFFAHELNRGNAALGMGLLDFTVNE
jgi:hypothetical protein